ncbi:hypothetical protein BPS26883_03757 [Burkholderia pseudomultivorans]|uniref:Uncharacterized protein n=2 Tax=Burkholderia pseudomultivorans TaxID=1207504 RepID=A0A6P2MG27_9BURK|nr:hypothetical protein [Burkholderia pseudomultivorans]VWB78817.1 hypothetical protein BPS26883_03757 [Burkholderia pseudomultivorans]
MSEPDLRRPVSGPYRQSRWSTALARIFGAVSKGMMIVAMLAFEILVAAMGGSAGFSGAPATKEGRWRGRLVFVACVALIAALYWWQKHAAGMAARL